MSIRIQVLLWTFMWSWRKEHTSVKHSSSTITPWTWSGCTDRHHCTSPCTPPSSLCLWTFAVLASPCAPVCILHIEIWLSTYDNFMYGKGSIPIWPSTVAAVNIAARVAAFNIIFCQLWQNDSHRQDRLCRIRQTPGTRWQVEEFWNSSENVKSHKLKI